MASYGKRPIWQWIVIYLVVGLIVYGLVYYFLMAKSGNSIYNSSNPPIESGSDNY